MLENDDDDDDDDWMGWNTSNCGTALSMGWIKEQRMGWSSVVVVFVGVAGVVPDDDDDDDDATMR